MPDLKAYAESIISRRTINFFRSEPVPLSVLLEAIEVARWAPNHRQTEPWHFSLMGAATTAKTVELITELKSRGQGDDARAAVSKRLNSIPGWLVISSALSADPVVQQENYAASCCAAQNLMLYLWQAGVGVKWTSGAVIRDKRLYDILGLDTAKVMIIGLFWYGYPEHIPVQTRKTVDDICSILD